MNSKREEAKKVKVKIEMGFRELKQKIQITKYKIIIKTEELEAREQELEILRNKLKLDEERLLMVKEMNSKIDWFIKDGEKISEVENVIEVLTDDEFDNIKDSSNRNYKNIFDDEYHYK